MTELVKIVGEKNLQIDEPLSLHSTIGVGGCAKYFASPQNFFDLIRIVRYAQDNKLPYKIIGNGSNILFDDSEFFGIIITTKNIVSYVEIENEHVLVSSGVMIGMLCEKLKNDCLSGLEWAFGIPATVGGAVVMNAGAFGCEMKDIIYSVTFFENNKIKTLKKNDLNFAYRSSYFKNTDTIIMSAELLLCRDLKKNIDERMRFYLEKRREKQPQGKSLGSIFKNADKPAGFLIDQVGLKGAIIGGAEISAKHANFIINREKASASDIRQLIDRAKQEVNSKFNIELREEIEIIT